MYNFINSVRVAEEQYFACSKTAQKRPASFALDPAFFVLTAKGPLRPSPTRRKHGEYDGDFTQTVRLVSRAHSTNKNSRQPRSVTRPIILKLILCMWDRSSTVIKVPCYKSEGRLVRSLLVSLEFFIDIRSFWSHYGPRVDSASNRNEYQEHFLGVKAAGA